MATDRKLGFSPVPSELTPRYTSLRTADDLVREGRLRGSRVIERLDFDIPINNGATTKFDPTAGIRVDNSVYGMNYALGHGAELVYAITHMGKPAAERKEGKEPTSTAVLVPMLEEKLHQRVIHVPDILDTEGVRELMRSSGARVFIGENARFWPGEEANDPEFARRIAQAGDVYINDAIGVSHRKHASMVALAEAFPRQLRAAGPSLVREVAMLSGVVERAKNGNLVVIQGGSKVADKLATIQYLVKIARCVAIGGKIAAELWDDSKEGMPELREMLLGTGKVMIAGLTADGYDIDERSIEAFGDAIDTADTVVWNGLVGMADKGYSKGSDAMLDRMKNSPAKVKAVLGGDTGGYVKPRIQDGDGISVSAGGGSSLDVLAGKEMAGFEPLLAA